jgi:hypothetical protein
MTDTNYFDFVNIHFNQNLFYLLLSISFIWVRNLNDLKRGGIESCRVIYMSHGVHSSYSERY